MADAGRYRALYESAAPGTDPSRFTFLGEGWDNIVFLLDDERIVRFAKDARTARLLEIEAALLLVIAPRMPVPVPRPEQVVRPPAAPEIAFMVYRRLSGLPLDDALVRGIAPDLAHALDVLHGIPPSALDGIEIPRFNPDGWVERHRTLYRQTRADVRTGLSADEFARHEAWWHDYLADSVYRAFQPCLVHGDLVPEHLLVDPASRSLSGIIDFGDAMWADPALDLAGMPDPLARAVVAEMRSVGAGRGLWTRRAAYRRIAPLHAVFAGRDLGRPELTRSGIEALRRLIAS